MIINLILLGSVLGVSYQSWRKQRETYNKKLFDKHQQTTSALKPNTNQKKNLPVSSSTTKRKSSKELASLVTAMSLSSIGYWLYSPLSYLSVPFILFSVRKKIYSAWGSVKKGKLEIETLAVITIFGTMIGQRFFIAGEMISADGEIVWGGAGIDEHRLTGESIPVEKNTGERVFAMTVVLSGKIHFKIEQAGAKTSAMKIANIINETSFNYQYDCFASIGIIFYRYLGYP
jgi:cation transport ATPase